ncbi:hypothetical protein TPL01_31610 [Sulfuriferula plumbiphila]|uniref:Uncharacterized protein n=1 Tax=Sulfuriferula plumbiphila TaxID=171865 RepID=A0A512LC10_9PROT|nr:hypothetical protein [Sulfuriferula plumbiphila]BBP04723.1 hypothetical protein SFPGR_21450 [Sulfuriferula plumbiphila]GEP32023.1 hypothetical protein TPL01_31610 [Sulfuriferula plumbiphila]
MSNHPLFDHNRVILSHYDSYSAALVFARYGASILATTPLPQSAVPMPAPGDVTELHDPGAVLAVIVAQAGLDPAQLRLDEGFQEWKSSDSGPIRLHLVRFTTLDTPRQAIELLGGVFKSISEMRGLPMIELNLMRQIFNLTMGG